MVQDHSERVKIELRACGERCGQSPAERKTAEPGSGGGGVGLAGHPVDVVVAVPERRGDSPVLNCSSAGTSVDRQDKKDEAESR